MTHRFTSRTIAVYSLVLLLLALAVPARAVVVEVQVQNEETGAPVANATIRIGDTEAVADERGRVTLDLDAQEGDRIDYVVVYRADTRTVRTTGAFTMPAATGTVTVALPAVAAPTLASPAAEQARRELQEAEAARGQALEQLDAIPNFPPPPGGGTDTRFEDAFSRLRGALAKSAGVADRFQSADGSPELDEVIQRAQGVSEAIAADLREGEARRAALREAAREPAPTGPAAQAEYDDAYKDLGRVRAEADDVRRRMEPYQQWRRAQDEIDEATRAADAARAALRKAEEELDKYGNPAQAPPAARAARARAQQAFDAADERRDIAIGDRNQIANDLFADAQGRRPTKDEIEERYRALDDQLENLEAEERRAAERVDDAGRRAFGGGPVYVGPTDAVPQRPLLAPPHTPEELIAGTDGDPAPVDAPATTPAAVTPSPTPAPALQRPVVEFLNPGMQPVNQVNKYEPFFVQVRMPAGDDAPDDAVRVTLRTPHDLWRGRHVVTLEKKSEENGIVTYRSRLQYWEKETGWANPFEDIPDALDNLGAFVGFTNDPDYADDPALYSVIRADNGDTMTGEFGDSTAGLVIYDTWVQQGIANTARGFDLARDFYTWLNDQLLPLEDGGYVSPEAVRQIKDALPPGFMPSELTMLGDGGAITADQVEALTDSVQRKIDMLPRVRTFVDGLPDDQAYQKYFASFRALQMLLNDPDGWTLYTDAGYPRATKYSYPLPNAFGIAIDGAVRDARDAEKKGASDALKGSLIRGYAAFAGATGGGALWTLASTALASAEQTVEQGTPTLAAGTTAMGDRASGWDIFVAAVEVYAGPVIAGKLGQMAGERTPSLAARKGSEIESGPLQPKAAASRPAARPANEPLTEKITPHGDTLGEAGTVQVTPQGFKAPTVYDRVGSSNSPAVNEEIFTAQLKGTKLAYADGETVTLDQYGGGGAFQRFFRVRGDDGAADNQFGLKVIVNDEPLGPLHDMQLGATKLDQVGMPHTSVGKVGVTEDGVVFYKTDLIPEDGHMLAPGEMLTPQQQHNFFGNLNRLNTEGHAVWSDPNIGNFHTVGDVVSIHDPDFIGWRAQPRIDTHMDQLALAPPESMGAFATKPINQRLDIVNSNPETAQALFLVQKGAVKKNPVTGQWEKGWADPEIFFKYYTLEDAPAPMTVPAGPLRPASASAPFAVGFQRGVRPFGLLAGFGLSGRLVWKGDDPIVQVDGLTEQEVTQLKNDPNVAFVEPVLTKTAQLVADQAADDPYFASRGAWGQPYDDQWALKQIGFEAAGGRDSVWRAMGEIRQPVIVAVIDTGLDYFHPDLRPENVWRNPDELPNGRDDDGDGYVDDLIGWNFVDDDNNPWDHAGHGTHVAGIIAAATGNHVGIAGINPRARIMALRALDFRGRGSTTRVAEAIRYAVEHGARVINLSLGGDGVSDVERRAIGYARGRGVLVVVAAGNTGVDSATFGPAGVAGAITVASTDTEDERTAFSNWGPAVNLAAPGVEILSLRARDTDLNSALGVKGYQRRSAIVGDDYYRATGTSLSAPFVTGVASLLLGRNPELTADQVEHMLLMSADDVDVPGWDQYTGFGRLNAVGALQADPDWYLDARVTAVQPVQEHGGIVRVSGTVQGSALAEYVVELGQGVAPRSWTAIASVKGRGVADGTVGEIPFKAITARGKWTIRVVARDRQGREREARGDLTVE